MKAYQPDSLFSGGPEVEVREAEARLLAELLRLSRVTTLYGAAGSGKTALLKNGVMRRLYRRASDHNPRQPQDRVVVPMRRRASDRGPEPGSEIAIYFDQWDDAPLAALEARFRILLGIGSYREQGNSTNPGSLLEQIKFWNQVFNVRFLVVLDQFEKLLQAQANSDGARAFADEFANMVNDPEARLNFLVSLREDAEALLAPLQARIPTLGETHLSLQPIQGLPDLTQDLTQISATVPPSQSPLAPPAVAAPPVAASPPVPPLQQEASSFADQLPSRMKLKPYEPTANPRTTAPKAEPSIMRPAVGDDWRFEEELIGRIPPRDGNDTASTFAERTRQHDEPTEPYIDHTSQLTPFSIPPADVTDSATRSIAKAPPAARGARKTSTLSDRLVRAAPVLLIMIVVALVGTIGWMKRDSLFAIRDVARVGLEQARSVRISPPRTEAEAPANASSPTKPELHAEPALPAAAAVSAAAPQTPVDIVIPANDPSSFRMVSELALLANAEGPIRFDVRTAATPNPLESPPSAAGVRLAVLPYDFLQTLRSAKSTRPGLLERLHIVMPLHTQEIHFLVRADSPLRSVHEIRGRRINIGPADSAGALTARLLYQRMFEQTLAYGNTYTFDHAEALRRLVRDRSIDVLIVVAAQPAQWIAELPDSVRQSVKLLALDRNNPASERAVAAYLPTSVHATSYRNWLQQDVPTLAVMDVLVSEEPRDGSSQKVVDEVAASLCAKLPALQRAGHPKWREVQPGLELPMGFPYSAAALTRFQLCTAQQASTP